MHVLGYPWTACPSPQAKPCQAQPVWASRTARTGQAKPWSMCHQEHAKHPRRPASERHFIPEATIAPRPAGTRPRLAKAKGAGAAPRPTLAQPGPVLNPPIPVLCRPAAVPCQLQGAKQTVTLRHQGLGGKRHQGQLAKGRRVTRPSNPSNQGPIAFMGKTQLHKHPETDHN